jgi:uncharacterized membrane protein
LASIIKTLLNSVIIVAILLALDTTISLVSRGPPILSLSVYSFIEGATLMVVAGLMDIGGSAIMTAVRRLLFRTGENWSYEKYGSSNLKLSLLMSGAIMFFVSVALVL